jgi:hypothetical protein
MRAPDFASEGEARDDAADAAMPPTTSLRVIRRNASMIDSGRERRHEDRRSLCQAKVMF